MCVCVCECVCVIYQSEQSVETPHSTQVPGYVLVHVLQN